LLMMVDCASLGIGQSTGTKYMSLLDLNFGAAVPMHQLTVIYTTCIGSKSHVDFENTIQNAKDFNLVSFWAQAQLLLHSSYYFFDERPVLAASPTPVDWHEEHEKHEDQILTRD